MCVSNAASFSICLCILYSVFKVLQLFDLLNLLHGNSFPFFYFSGFFVNAELWEKGTGIRISVLVLVLLH